MKIKQIFTIVLLVMMFSVTIHAQLYIAPGQASAVLTVKSGTALTVTDLITNSSTASAVVIESGASLIQINNVSNVGAITVNRNSAPQVRLDYTLWSSPVAAQNLFGFSPNTLTNRFYIYDTAANGYVTTGLTSATTFAPAKGYGIRAPYDYTTTPTVFNGVFTGIPNNGNVNYTLDNSGSGFNLTGNPYPSTLDATAFVTANSGVITGTLYFYAHTLTKQDGTYEAGTNYATWNSLGATAATVGTSGVVANTPTGIIQPGQGFIVKSIASGNLTFTNTMRSSNVSSSNPFFKMVSGKTTDSSERHRIWLNLSNDQGVGINQILVGYTAGASEEEDLNYDSLEFGDSKTSLTSKINGKSFTIQGRGLPFNTNDVVNLGFKAAVAGKYTIALSKTDGLFADTQEVYLKDNLTGKVQDLKSESYSFTANEGVADTRFELLYNKPASVKTVVLDKMMITVANNGGVFHVNTNGAIMKEISVFDIQGRLLFKQKNINSTTSTLTGLPAIKGVLILKIISDANETSVVKVLN